MEKSKVFVADTAIVKNAKIGEGTKIWSVEDVYGCQICENTVFGNNTALFPLVRGESKRDKS